MKPLYLSIFIINLVLSSYVLLASIPLVGANTFTDFDTPPSNLLRGENLHLIKLCPLNLLVSLLKDDWGLAFLTCLVDRCPTSLLEHTSTLVNLLMQLILLDLEQVIIKDLLSMAH